MLWMAFRAGTLAFGGLKPVRLSTVWMSFRVAAADEFSVMGGAWRRLERPTRRYRSLPFSLRFRQD